MKHKDFLNLYNHFFFDKDGGGGGGDDPDNPDNPDGNGDNPDDSRHKDGGNVTFTDEQQKKIDELVGEARKSGKTKALTDFLKGLGFEKEDDLKNALKTLKDIEDKNKTDLEKLTERADEAEKKLGETAGTLEEKEKIILNLRLKQDFSVVSGDMEISYPNQNAFDDAFEALNKELISVEEGDDGKVVIKGMKEAIKKLKEERPYLFSSGKSRVGTPIIHKQKPDGVDKDKKDGKLVKGNIRL